MLRSTVASSETSPTGVVHGDLNNNNGEANSTVWTKIKRRVSNTVAEYSSPELANSADGVPTMKPRRAEDKETKEIALNDVWTKIKRRVSNTVAEHSSPELLTAAVLERYRAKKAHRSWRHLVVEHKKQSPKVDQQKSPQSQELSATDKHSEKPKQRSVPESSKKGKNGKVTEKKKAAGRWQSQIRKNNKKLRTFPKAWRVQAQVKMQLLTMSYGCADVQDFYHRIFRTLDIGKKGQVSVDNMISGLRKQCKVSPEDLRTMCAFMDKNDDGEIDFDEFFDFLEITEKDVLTVKMRNIPPSATGKLDWCLERVQDRTDLTFALHLLSDIVRTSTNNIPLVKKGLAMELWGLVATFDKQSDPEESLYMDTVEAITKEQRDLAVEVLESLSKCFATLASKRGKHPLPDPNAMVSELHKCTVKLATIYYMKGDCEPEASTAEPSIDLGQTLEERLEGMRSQLALTMESLQEEEEGGEKRIPKRLVDSEMILFLLHCISAQLRLIADDRWPELVECVLLSVAEEEHEVLCLGDCHRLTARNILAHCSPRQLQMAIAKHKRGGGRGRVNQAVITTGRVELRKKKQMSAHNSQWGKMRKSREQEAKDKAWKRREQLKRVETQRKCTLAACAVRSAKRRKAAELKQRRLEQREARERQRRQKEMKSRKAQSERRWAATRKKNEKEKSFKKTPFGAPDYQLLSFDVNDYDLNSLSWTVSPKRSTAKKKKNRRHHNRPKPRTHFRTNVDEKKLSSSCPDFSKSLPRTSSRPLLRLYRAPTASKVSSLSQTWSPSEFDASIDVYI